MVRRAPLWGALLRFGARGAGGTLSRDACCSFGGDRRSPPTRARREASAVTEAYLNRIVTAIPSNDVHAKFVVYAPSLLATDRDRLLFRRMAARSGRDRQSTHRNSSHKLATRMQSPACK